MFNKFYTTQMSGSAKTLQKRFTEIRRRRGKAARHAAAVMAAVMAVSMLAATAAMAAIGADGLEYYHENELYILGREEFIIHTYNLTNQPEWFSMLAGDEHRVDAKLDIANVRDTRGWVSKRCILTISGNGRTVTLYSDSPLSYPWSDELNSLFITKNPDYNPETMRRMTFHHENMDLSENNKSDKKAVFFIDINEAENKINNFAVLFDADDIFESDKNNYQLLDISNLTQIGDFIGAVRYKNNGYRYGYYTYFEDMNYINRAVDGIDIKVVETKEDYIKIKANINHAGIDSMCCDIYSADAGSDMIDATAYYHLPVSDTITLMPQHFNDNGNITGKFEKGKTYIIDFICMKNFPGYSTIRYRQREYVTIE